MRTPTEGGCVEHRRSPVLACQRGHRHSAPRVGVWATNASTELFFRQVVGRFVRVIPGLPEQDVTSLPHLAALYIANYAAGIAFICGVGARIEEATFIRWRHIHAHAIYIPGTKSHNAPRWVPRQAALEPWITILRALAGGDPHPDEFVLRLRKDGDRRTPPSDKTWAGRIAQIEMEAGLKIPTKRAHILRATHASQARLVLPTAALKTYLGHAKPFGGATDDYVDTRPPFIPRAHQRYLKLPDPAQVEEHAHELRG
jgi:integrase